MQEIASEPKGNGNNASNQTATRIFASLRENVAKAYVLAKLQVALSKPELRARITGLAVELAAVSIAYVVATKVRATSTSQLVNVGVQQA